MGIRITAAIGNAKLEVPGLSPQRISTESEARFPAAATWKGMDYQATGLGEKRLVIEARTAPHVFKGLDALGWLIRHHEASERVNYNRLGAAYACTVGGPVSIRALYYNETHLHPFDGVGRIVDVEIDLIVHRSVR
ncbi:hypothetical protein [Afifella marina]|uniref:Uncharacterized protein n=1 Tax=Afifella marina DSM 2698 TaxID=1120955 RepID=A0A1G5MFG5_AFIMA|nr:hypothetical protein [Afifella marina]MBK1625205.1 hypothetical protein [Afifella marina DSM 2698]MBK1628922.1 hypothetical protein [Afifella marina]MBK5918301.1 hypothetical protein [Afifella marina]RAI22820.1 hypothetical protein CH311_03985 [Afifella marina DSM 2698]SCZ23882.1 hypothetical protein SAMN03080610_00619 [Afifella marina DSM 2698]